MLLRYWRSIVQILAAAIIFVSVAWFIYDPGWEPILALFGGITTGIGSFFAPNDADSNECGTITSIVKNTSCEFILQPESDKSLHLPQEIPSPPADFIGRDDELQNLRKRFDRGTNIAGERAYSKLS
jgi:hypothetical protein